MPASKRFVSIDEFVAEQDRPTVAGIRSAGTVDLENSSGRLISYVLSDTSVGRDNHVVAANAWQTDSFLRNPVMPWAHDTSAPPIAKWIDIATRNNRLVGTAEYADRDTYDFADTIFRLVKGGFLNAVSTSWLPLEWKFTSDRSRPGGIDFLKVDLLECSQVPVPALPTALVTARAQGIDTGPIVAWCERLLDSNDYAMLPRSELETLRREAKMPKARKQPVVKPAVEPEPAPAVQTPPVKRSLYQVSWLAYLLEDLGYLHSSAEFEAAIEEDGSAVPGQLLAALKQLGEILVAMTAEEVAELLAGKGEDDDLGEIEMSSDAGVKRAAFRLMRRLDAGAIGALSGAMRSHLEGRTVTFKVGDAVTAVGPAIERAGRVLSADNERCLREAHDHMTKAVEIVRGVVDQVGDEDQNDDDPAADSTDETDKGETERAARARRAQALKLRVTTAA